MMAAMKIDENLNEQTMSLKQLLSDYVAINCVPDIPVTGLCLDSRQVKPGNVFVALEGHTEHGLAFAEAALNKGAVAILCDRQFDQYCQQILSSLMTRVICIPINNLKENLGSIVSDFHDQPSKDLFMVGVTGTDGKTSVSHFIAQTLDERNNRSALIGTIGNGIVGELEETVFTTPQVIQVHSLLADMKNKGATQVAMEVSSHGLDQGRVDAVEFDVAVLTNMGRDHLDYHGDIESYQQAKRQLFECSSLKAAVLNLDDDFGLQLAAELNNKLTLWGYTLSDENPDIKNSAQNIIQASSVKVHASGISMHVKTPLGEADLELSLLGQFNVDNALATLAVLLIKGVDFFDAISRLKKLQTVAGRMQAIRVENKPLVVIDFAHTPQALGAALKSLRQHCQQKLICVFGCGGDRDKGKRPLMAQAAGAYADKIIVTDDNPRTENAENIIKDIQTGFKNTSNVQIINDREKAICFAVENAKEGDIVLVAGKGHEDYQIIGNEKQPFSDTLIVKKTLGVSE
jgi:UDP-N-acetylmuramoyl-L-alanyl-D-glutamate--2,6-diaminopimelate ligase